MTEKEIKSRILICELRERDYLEVGNTKTADRYRNEICKWEDLLGKLNPKRDEELRTYKSGYNRLEKATTEALDLIKSNCYYPELDNYSNDLDDDDIKKIVEILRG